MLEKSTIYEVARHSGVSTATVSRVMRDSAGFSEPTRQRVLAAAAELGWLPNGSARGLAERRVGIVGLLFPDLGKDAEAENESPLFVDQVIRGAERAATLAGDAVLIAATRGAGGRDLARSVASKVDGLVVTARSLSGPDLTAIARSIPVVVIASQPGRRKFDVVSADNHEGSRAVTEHLLETHGYRDLAFVAGPAHSPDSVQRFAGFREALGAAGLKVPTDPDAHGGFTEAGGERALEEILTTRRTPPQAVVFGNDEMAIGGMSLLRQQKLRVPLDVAITGFDDIASARHVRPTLTTVRQPMRELGEQAVRILLERLREPDTAKQALILPTQLQIRRSCGCRTSPARTTTRSSR
ncbi:MAG: LacI family transcriptional regulator [Actinomycetota bacterium]|nr:LacI family transcriptional regulator [Actinomycetota bacterium]MDQ2957464.1 LacI family transcriptional regulator [Actinomycetota bacterium]